MNKPVETGGSPTPSRQRPPAEPRNSIPSNHTNRAGGSRLKGEGLDEVRSAAIQFLSRDTDWRVLAKEALAGVVYESNGSVDPIAVARRQAFDAAAAGDYSHAIDTLRQAINANQDEVENGWYLEEVATYLQLLGEPEDAQKAVAKGRSLNPVVLRPKVQAKPQKVLRASVQSQAAHAFLTKHYKDAKLMRLGIRQTLDGIAFDPDSTDQAEESLRLLGLHLGFASIRPDREGNEGPDNLIAISATVHAVIEAKTGVTRQDPVITKSESAQLNEAMRWHERNYPEVRTRIPVIIHPSSVRDRQASPPSSTRVITPSDLERLKQDARGFSDRIAAEDRWTNSEAVLAALKEFHLDGESFISAHSTPLTE